MKNSSTRAIVQCGKNAAGFSNRRTCGVKRKFSLALKTPEWSHIMPPFALRLDAHNLRRIRRNKKNR
jgi:hypothetical protein